MNIKEFYTIGGILAIVLICSGIFINSFNISNSKISSFVQKSEDFERAVNNTKSVSETITTENSISGIIENIPLLGSIVRGGKYIASMVGVFRAGVDILAGFVKDILSEDVMGIPSSVILIIVSIIIVYFAYAVYKDLRGL